MNKFSSTAIIALMTAALGLSAIAPAMAQDAPAAPAAITDVQTAENGPGGHGPGPMGQDENGPRRGGGFGGLFNFERGAEAIEVAFVHISHAITLTDAQKPLLDDLKTTALAAQAEFATVLEASKPAADATTRPDVTTMVKNRIAVETAHAKALSTILPKLEAFTASLTDEQKTALTPAPRDDQQMGQQGGGKNGAGGHRPGQHNGQNGGQHNGQHGGANGGPANMAAPAPVNG